MLLCLFVSWCVSVVFRIGLGLACFCVCCDVIAFDLRCLFGFLLLLICLFTLLTNFCCCLFCGLFVFAIALVIYLVLACHLFLLLLLFSSIYLCSFGLWFAVICRLWLLWYCLVGCFIVLVACCLFWFRCVDWYLVYLVNWFACFLCCFNCCWVGLGGFRCFFVVGFVVRSVSFIWFVLLLLCFDFGLFIVTVSVCLWVFGCVVCLWLLVRLFACYVSDVVCLVIARLILFCVCVHCCFVWLVYCLL